MSDVAQRVAETVAIRLLDLALAELLEGSPDSPLVEELRRILPPEGAAARARRDLEGG